MDRRELPYIVAHEYLERRLMRDAHLGYDHAHAICSTVEFELRKNDRIKLFLAPGQRKIHKRDLPKLTVPALFRHVVEHYARK